MARYAISPEGVAALQKLADDLSMAVNEIETDSSRMLNIINSLEPDLGIYYKEIMVLIREILKTLTDAIDGDGYGIRYLVLKRIPSLITIMEEFIQMGLGSGDDEEPAVPETELKRSR